MNPLKISMVLPFPVTKPVGGAKIMYEYANRLAERGHRVTVFHSIKRPFKYSRTPVWLRRFVFFLRGVERPGWFDLDSRVGSKIVPEISDMYLPEADIVMSTWWQMAYAINAMSPSRGRKFNFIQDHEIWKGQQELVHKSYSLDLHHIVIARYLQDLVHEKSGRKPVHIPNAIDTSRFRLMIPPEKRDSFSVIMMYSQEPRKGTQFGMQCLLLLKERFPALRVTLFGVYEEPSDLPEGFIYHRRPSNLPELFNQSAIFASPSLGEGWALPPAEAMACGCALACTEIGGHLDYAVDGDTAVLFPPSDSDAMFKGLFGLMTDTEERIRLSRNGHQMITGSFSWEKSVAALEDQFYRSLKN